MLGIHALSASLSLTDEVGIDVIEEEISAKIDYLIKSLARNSCIRFLTPLDARRRAGILTFTIDGLDMATLHQTLMENNIICAHRMGGIRFSPHFYTNREKIDKALEVLILSI